MKYYDKRGETHNSIVGAMMTDVQQKVDEVLCKKIAGYEAVSKKKISHKQHDTPSENNEPVNATDDGSVES